MLRKILEAKLRPMSDREFEDVMDLTTADIKINRVNFGKQTSLSEAIEIVARCFIVLGRGKIA